MTKNDLRNALTKGDYEYIALDHKFGHDFVTEHYEATEDKTGFVQKRVYNSEGTGKANNSKLSNDEMFRLLYESRQTDVTNFKFVKRCHLCRYLQEECAANGFELTCLSTEGKEYFNGASNHCTNFKSIVPGNARRGNFKHSKARAC